MNKLNKELINIKKQLDKFDLQGKTYENDAKYKFLQDKLHLYFDSTTHDTTDAEKYIMNIFWQNAYTKYKDGGYVTNDLTIREIRYPYELMLMKKMIKKHCKNFDSALELGCGNGKTCEFLSNKFKNVVGVDLSQSQIEKNQKNNSHKNIKYLCQNAFDVDEKYDFVFASDMFTCTPDSEMKAMFKKLTNLLKGGGVLLVRESSKISGKDENYASKNYVAYYRNHKTYTKGIFKPYFVKKYRNYGYSAYHLGKYFSVFGEKQKEKIKKNPKLFKKIVKNFVNPHLRTSHFYVYRKFS